MVLATTEVSLASDECSVCRVSVLRRGTGLKLFVAVSSLLLPRQLIRIMPCCRVILSLLLCLKVHLRFLAIDFRDVLLSSVNVWLDLSHWAVNEGGMASQGLAVSALRAVLGCEWPLNDVTVDSMRN